MMGMVLRIEWCLYSSTLLYRAIGCSSHVLQNLVEDPIPIFDL